jgi:outer membrane protein assembly complex protein YaeT
VESLVFTGNRAVSPRRLRPLVETRPAGLLQAGRFRQEVLDRDLRILESFYRAEGYPDVVVGPAEIRFSADRTRVQIAIPIQEGLRLLVGDLTVEGARLLTTAELVAAIPLKPGGPWSEQRAEESRRILERLYARHGHLAAGVLLETDRREGRVEVVFRIREGEGTRIGRILVGGLLTTEERVVRQELPFGPGDPFDPEKLQEAERRLSELGLFERVEVGPLRPQPAPYADVDVTLREGRPWRLDLGAGYSTDQEWRTFLEVGHDNLFGTGRGASVRETLASKGDRSDLVYRARHLFDSAWQSEASLFREQWREIGYRRQTAGGTAGIQRPLFPDRLRGLRSFFTYRLNWVRRYDVDRTLAAADVVAGSQLVASLTPSLILDRRNNPGDPTRGSSHLLSLEVGDGVLGSEVNFVKFQLETRWFLDWLSPTVIALAGRLGLAAPYGGTPALDIADRFKAGGHTTIRGYPEDRVGPVDAVGNPAGGNGRLLLNAEWRFPVWRWLGGVLFVDSGTVTPEAGDLLRGSFKTGVGGGLRVGTPIGPLRVDVGYALNGLPRREDRWHVSFGIGHPF